jgi:hypothetical protein
MLIVATAAVGLALVGVLAARMTPGRGATRDALVSVTTSSVITELTASSFGDVAGAATGTGRRFTDLIGRTFASLLASTSSSPVSTAAGGADLVVVTPFGADGLGVTTAAAVAGRRGTIDAVLPSGDVVSAELVDTRDGVAIVELADGTDTTAGPTLSKFADDWTVVAFGAEIRVSEDDDLRSLRVPEAAPIFDADGNLVGLCTIGPNGVEMLPVETLPDADPPVVVATEQPDAATTESTESTESTETSDPTAATDSVPTASTQPSLLPGAPPSPPASPPTTPAPGSSDVPASTAASEPIASSEPPTSSLS